MFRSVIYEAWLNWVPCLAFAVTAGVFLTFALRALNLRRERAEEMARLPLDD